MFDYANYRKQVLQEYKEKRDAKALSSRLTHPTPASLKSACVATCNDRFLKKDEKVLSTFFGAGDNQKAYIHAIEQFDRDKFKPLQKFLKGQTFETHPANIELLAWLIDFESRPFDPKKDYGDNEKTDENKETESWQEKNNAAVEEIAESGEEIYEAEKGTIDGTKHTPGSQEQETKRRIFSFMTDARKRVFFFVGSGSIMLVLIIAAVFWFSKNNGSPMFMSATGGCMYWTDDHYEPVPCNKKMDNTLIIALDTVKVRHFKKITRCDTITAKDLGSVWYSKIDNKVEFFTSPGNHPVHVEYKLKPATKYIIETYCNK